MFCSWFTSKVMGCSEIPFTASSSNELPMAKRHEPSLSVSSNCVYITFSLSEAVRWRTLSLISKTKSPRMGRAFLLLMTLESAESLLLRAVLDNVNRIIIIVRLFLITYYIIGTKLQKNVVMNKIIGKKLCYSNYF